MAEQIPGPLTPQHLAQINAGIDYAAQAAQHIAMAKQAGMDVSHYEHQLKEMMDKMLRVKNVYFPGQ